MCLKRLQEQRTRCFKPEQLMQYIIYADIHSNIAESSVSCVQVNHVLKQLCEVQSIITYGSPITILTAAHLHKIFGNRPLSHH